MSEIGEETGIEEQCCIELKCLTEEEGIQFLRMRTRKAGGEDSGIRELTEPLIKGEKREQKIKMEDKIADT